MPFRMPTLRSFTTPPCPEQSSSCVQHSSSATPLSNVTCRGAPPSNSSRKCEPYALMLLNEHTLLEGSHDIALTDICSGHVASAKLAHRSLNHRGNGCMCCLPPSPRPYSLSISMPTCITYQYMLGSWACDFWTHGQIPFNVAVISLVNNIGISLMCGFGVWALCFISRAIHEDSSMLLR